MKQIREQIDVHIR
ncbi:unnamed protein product, partial [Rotaria socialis]